MNDSKLVWSDELGDLRKSNSNQKNTSEVNEKDIVLHLRRLTSGKGRTMIEVSNLPTNDKWCKKLVKEFKQKLGVGGAYKNNVIEVHCADIMKVCNIIELRCLQWKKTGG